MRKYREQQSSIIKQEAETLLKVDYTTGDLDTEAKIITALNATNTKINSLITKLIAEGILKA